MSRNHASNRYLTKLKIALATGGLAATLVGAGLLGQAASALASSQVEVITDVVISEPAPIQASDRSVLELNLEAIPTVSAPTFSGTPLTFGRSSA